MDEQITKQSTGWGIASLTTSIISLLIFLMPYFGLPLAIFSIVASFKQKKIGGTGLGTAGLAIGIISTTLNGILFLLFLVLVFLGLAK